MSEFKAPTKTQENPGELYFTWYLDELIKHGFLKSYDREPEMIIVLPSYKHKREKHFKTKPNEFEEINLTPEITYTYDFRLVWEEKALNIFTEIFTPGGHFRFGIPTFVSHYIKLMEETEIVSFVDVKPHQSAARFGGKVSSFYTFPFIQKYLMATRNLYINKAIPTNAGKSGVNTCLFAKTFTPNRYTFTDQGQMQRKIPFKKNSIMAYVRRQSEIIDSMLEQDRKKNEKNQQQSLL